MVTNALSPATRQVTWKLSEVAVSKSRKSSLVHFSTNQFLPSFAVVLQLQIQSRDSRKSRLQISLLILSEFKRNLETMLRFYQNPFLYLDIARKFLAFFYYFKSKRDQHKPCQLSVMELFRGNSWRLEGVN